MPGSDAIFGHWCSGCGDSWCNYVVIFVGVTVGHGVSGAVVDRNGSVAVVAFGIDGVLVGSFLLLFFPIK